jgi:hypothetical protein
VLEDLQDAVARVNDRLPGSRLDVQPLPQPGRGCRARFLVRHNYSNSPNISRTEVAIAFGGQIGARFTWTMDGEWDDLLMRFVNEDQRWVAKIAKRGGGRG